MIINSVDKLLKVVKDLDPQKISVDGESGQGKTYVAHLIVQQLGYEWIDVDNLTTGENGNYSIDSVKLKNELDKFQGKKMVIDGITLIDVLDNIGMTPDLRIYVKRCNKNGEWIHWNRDKYTSEDIYSGGKTQKQILDDYADSPVKKEILEYHFNKKPHESADIIFLNIDGKII